MKNKLLAELAKEVKESIAQEKSMAKEYGIISTWHDTQTGYTNGLLRAIEIVNKILKDEE